MSLRRQILEESLMHHQELADFDWRNLRLGVGALALGTLMTGVGVGVAFAGNVAEGAGIAVIGGGFSALHVNDTRNDLRNYVRERELTATRQSQIDELSDYLDN